MAKKQSFDISTSVDFQEVDNAVNQTIKETQTRYDFKGTTCELDFDREAGSVKLEADDQFRLDQLIKVFREIFCGKRQGCTATVNNLAGQVSRVHQAIPTKGDGTLNDVG